MPSRPRMKPIMSCRLLPGILGVCGPTSLRASISQTIVTSVYRAQAPYSTKGNPVLSHAREILPQPPNRWVADVRARIGKCISFGCSDAQVTRAAGVLGVLARKWRALSAGSEGFLTGGRRGLEDQQVVWGEMDSFVGFNFRFCSFFFFRFCVGGLDGTACHPYAYAAGWSDGNDGNQQLSTWEWKWK